MILVKGLKHLRRRLILLGYYLTYLYLRYFYFWDRQNFLFCRNSYYFIGIWALKSQRMLLASALLLFCNSISSPSLENYSEWHSGNGGERLNLRLSEVVSSGPTPESRQQRPGCPFQKWETIRSPTFWKGLKTKYSRFRISVIILLCLKLVAPVMN